MPIAKGQDWGWPGVLPADAPVVSSDAEAAAIIGLDPTHATRTIGLSGGDLARTLGIRMPYDRATNKHVVPVDAIRVVLDDDSEHVAVAHVVLGDLRRNRPGLVLMNAAFLGTRNIAPRGHPGDGKVDVVTMDLGPGDRIKAWQRMTTGSHVPHPDIKIRQRVSGDIDVGRARSVRVDGRAVGRSARVRFEVIAGAVLVAV